MGNIGASALFVSLKQVPTLLRLNISTGESLNKNKLGVDGAEPLKHWLNSPHCAIDTLSLNHLLLGSDGARTAFEGVANNTL